MNTTTTEVDEAAAPRVDGGPVKRGRLSMAQLLVVLVLIIVGSPFAQYIQRGDLLLALLLSIVLISTLIAVGGGRGKVMIAGLLAAPAFFGKWVDYYIPDLIPPAYIMVAAAAFVAFVIIELLRFIFRVREVNSAVLCAAVSVYLIAGLLWGFAYMLAAQLDPSSFKGVSDIHPSEGFEYIYFSFSTLSTVGLGDILPVSPVARMLAMLEAVSGAFYMTIIVARLVAVYTQER